MSQNQTETSTRVFDIRELAVGVLNASIDAGDGGLIERIRMACLLEAWGRLTGLVPPSGDDPEFDAKSNALFATILLDAADIAEQEIFTATHDA